MKISTIVRTGLIAAASTFVTAADEDIKNKQKGLLRGAQPSSGPPQDLNLGPIDLASKPKPTERKVQTSETTIVIENKCQKDMWLYMWYDTEWGQSSGEWSRLVGNGGNILGFPFVVNPVVHFFGYVSEEEHWGTISSQPNSPYCVPGDGRYYCGTQWNFGSTDTEYVHLNLSCPNPNDEQSPMPTPAPISGGANSGSDNEWLIAHNRRRESFHTNNEFRNRTYVPLQWSQDLATSAQEYADILITESNRRGSCFKQHNFNGNSYGGENLSRRRADYHAPKSAEEVLWGWFDDEEDRVPYYTHRTQVIWAGTQYVGCAQSSTTFSSGEWTYCQITVCRYLAPGNCGDNWLQYDKGAVYDLALRDSTECGPQCPAEGCS